MLKIKLSFPNLEDGFISQLQNEFKANNFSIEDVKQCLHIVKKCFIYNKPTFAHFLNYKELYRIEYNKIKYNTELKSCSNYLNKLNNSSVINYIELKKVENYINLVPLIIKYHLTEKLFLSFNDFRFIYDKFNNNNTSILHDFKNAVSSKEVRNNNSLELGLVEWSNNHNRF